MNSGHWWSNRALRRSATTNCAAPLRSAGLFDAVWEAMVRQVVDEVPLDVTDLPG
jgi:hypothetical protein